jgi:hypothetical protein
MDKEELAKLEKLSKETIEWLQANPNAELEEY